MTEKHEEYLKYQKGYRDKRREERKVLEWEPLTTKMTFKEITRDMVETKKGYLFLRICGMEPNDATRAMGRKAGLITVWRSHDPYFADVENFIVTHAKHYYEQAREDMVGRSLRQLEYLLLHYFMGQIGSGVKVETRTALDLIKALKPGSGKIEKGKSYEDTL